MNVSLVTSLYDLSDLASLAPGAVGEAAPIDVIRTGTFTDMNRNTVTITADDLDAFIANHTTGAAGQDIPIDVDHRRQEAAGWILRFFREGDFLRAVPTWNPHGVELVGGKMYRYISATINRAAKTIISVSLTNFPAVKNMAPVALSEFPVAVEAAADSDDIVLLFSERTEPMTVNKKALVVADVAASGDQTEVIEASEVVAPVVAATPAAVVADVADASAFQAEIARVRAEMQEQMTAALGEFRNQLAATVNLSETQRIAIIHEVVSGMRVEQTVADFASEVTSTGSHAIPLRAEDLRLKLLAIPQAHRGVVMEILSSIHRSGTVDFSEVGTSQGSQERVTLSAPIAFQLRAFVKSGGSVEDFFTANADILGEQGQYDLSAFSA